MNKKNSFEGLNKKYIIPLLCAAAVLRKENYLRELIIEAKRRRILYIKLYEALLQNYLFAGYPSAIISLKILKEYFPRVKTNRSDDMNLYHFKSRGVKNCRKIYGRSYDKLIENVNGFSPDLSSWLVLEGYGKVLGRRGLSLKERELCVVAVLSVLNYTDQLYSHINGSFRVGVKKIELDELIGSLNLLGNKKLSVTGNKVLIKYLKNKGVY